MPILIPSSKIEYILDMYFAAAAVDFSGSLFINIRIESSIIAFQFDT
jgi:hypothetical protein